MEHWTEQMWNDDVKQASFLTEGPAKEIHCKPAAFGPDLLSKAEGNIWRPRRVWALDSSGSRYICQQISIQGTLFGDWDAIFLLEATGQELCVS